MTTTDTPPTVDQATMMLAQRAALALTTDVAQDLAEQHGVCVRPLPRRRIDLTTGRVDIVPVPCGSTREDQCRPCADKSTRLRQDAPNLPLRPVERRTVGQVFGGKYRPSTFLTLTLDSYGRVDPDGAALNPGSYYYRRAARDAIHFPPCSIGSGRTPDAASDGTCSTSAQSDRNAAVPRTSTPRSAAPSPARNYGRSPPPPITRCGGPPTTSPSTRESGCRRGTTGRRASPTPTPAHRCRPSREPART